MTTDEPPERLSALVAGHDVAPGDIHAVAVQRGTCRYCGVETDGVPVDEVINSDTFSAGDPKLSDELVADTDHLCWACAHCMSTKSLLSGHWLVTPDARHKVSTGDLPEALADIRAGEYPTPYALHVADSPIQSQHAALWTPLVDTTDRLVCDYDGRTVRIAWGDLDDLVAAVEDCRWHGMRLDDIRSGRPRMADLASMGRAAWDAVDGVIAPHRGGPALALALTLSQSADDQDRDETTDGNATLQKFQ